MCDLWAKNSFTWKIAPPAGHFWCVRYPQEGSGNDYTKFSVNPLNRCGDINYWYLKSATLWSSPKLLETSSGTHVKVLSQVSCHLDTPLWRYPTLPVWKEICRKLLFNNLSIVWPIKILLISFRQEGPQMLCAKFCANWLNCLGRVRKSRFSPFCNVAYTTRLSPIH